jgi:hypothetical protein
VEELQSTFGFSESSEKEEENLKIINIPKKPLKILK